MAARGVGMSEAVKAPISARGLLYTLNSFILYSLSC